MNRRRCASGSRNRLRHAALKKRDAIADYGFASAQDAANQRPGVPGA